MKPFYCKVWKSWIETLDCCEECEHLEEEVVEGKNPRDKDQLQRFCNHSLMTNNRKTEYWDNYRNEWRDCGW